MSEDRDTVTISKVEYYELLHDAEFLEILKAHGVDNWEGYGEASCEMQDRD